MPSPPTDSSSIPALILAAGESRRMGRLKPLLPLGSRTVLQRAVDPLLTARLSPVFVVLGHEVEAIKASLSNQAVEIVVNPDYKDGMLSSLQYGVRCLPPDAPAFVLMLGDQPDIAPDVIALLVETWKETPESIVVPTYGRKRGHPILIDRHYVPALLSLREPHTLRDLVHALSTRRVEVSVPFEGTLLDLDTPEEYEAARRSPRFNA